MAYREGLVARVIASLAVGGEPREIELLPPHYREAARRIAEMLSYKGGVCPLCGRSGFTPRGYYLHLARSHRQYLEELASQLAERLVEG